LEYNTDGTMKQVTTTVAGPAQIKNLNPYDTVRAVTINTMSGIRTAASTGGNGNEGGTGKEGRQILTQISNNDWIRVKGVDFGSGAAKFKVRAAAASGSSGSIELRTGSNTGTLIGTCNITSTGGWTTWNTFECDANVSGVKDFLYLVFKGSASELFRLDWYIFEGTTQVVSSSSVVASSSSAAPSSSSVARSSSSAAPSSSSAVRSSSSAVPSSSSATESSSSAALSSSSAFESSSSADETSSSSEEIVSIAHYQLVTHSKTPTYYTIKGEPVGSAKPAKPGVYLVKEGSSVRKIVVR